jgi:hypothetical protein
MGCLLELVLWLVVEPLIVLGELCNPRFRRPPRNLDPKRDPIEKALPFLKWPGSDGPDRQ